MFDFGHLPSGDGFLVMEFLEGASLAHVVREGRMSERRAVTLLRGVCNALAAAHALGVIHRDLKPDNIFVCPDPDAPTGERTKILDFGIAKLGTGSATGPSSATKTGVVMGTPRYMSPEQCKGAGAVDHRADLYSIGCIMYELLCGSPPFVAEGAGELIAMHLFVAPERARTREPSISAAVDDLIASLLEKDPAKRPQSAAELAQRFTAMARMFGVTTMTPAAGIPIRASALVTAPTTPAIAVPTITTLSGAARQTVPGTPRSRKSLLLVASGLVVAAGVSIFALHGGSTPAPTPAAQPPPRPAPVVEAPPKVPAPTPPIEPPMVAPPAPVTPTPTPTPPVVAPPVATVPKHHPPPSVAKHLPPKVPVVKDPEPAPGSAAPPKVLIEKDL